MADTALTNVAVLSLARAKGKGVFARRAFAAGEVVYSERPLVCCKFVTEKEQLQTCAYCLHTTVKESDLAAYPGAFALLNARFPQRPPMPCAHGCSSEIYCDEVCRDAAWAAYHETLCPRDRAETHPYLRLHALCRRLRRTNPVMVARSFAMVRQAVRNDATMKTTVGDAFAPFQRFVGHRNAGQGDNEAFELVREIFANDTTPGIHDVVTLENFQTLNGAFLQNAQELHPVSDLHTFLQLRDAHALASMLTCFNLKIPQRMPFLVGKFMGELTASGTGMFPLANCTNHSCSPNVVSMSCHRDNLLDIVAVKPIAADEELHISYIDETLPVAQRRKLLKQEYLFDCTCEKCVADLTLS